MSIYTSLNHLLRHKLALGSLARQDSLVSSLRATHAITISCLRCVLNEDRYPKRNNGESSH